MQQRARPPWSVGLLMLALITLGSASPGVILAAQGEATPDPFAELEEAFEESGLDWSDDAFAADDATDRPADGAGPMAEKAVDADALRKLLFITLAATLKTAEERGIGDSAAIEKAGYVALLLLLLGPEGDSVLDFDAAAESGPTE